MRNTRNFGVATGRVSKGLTIHNNKDGSRKIQFTVAAPDNYVGKDGNRGTQFIPLEAFIPASQKGNGAFDYIDCGDMVSISYSIRNNNYTGKDGVPVYGLTLMADDVALLESKASKEARQAAKAAAS